MLLVQARGRALWSRLPERIRASPVAGLLRTRWAVAEEPSQEPGEPQEPDVVDDGPATRVVRTLADLDVELQELDRLATISDDALRAGFSQFEMELELSLPADPRSAAYRERWLELYRWLHGKPYTPANEVNAFDVQSHVDRPFPYSTQSPSTVGQHLIAVGHVIRTMDLAPGSQVLEMGPGWGNTTLALAQMGHHLTTIDIEPNFAELVAARASRVNADVTSLVGDFSLMTELGKTFDAVLFFECFHHAADHLGVIASLDRVVAPGGQVVFAAEPIEEPLPYPWGLRLNGESLWAIRKHGWLELGFQTSYFHETLNLHGWAVTQVNCPETPWGMIHMARRISETAPE